MYIMSFLSKMINDRYYVCFPDESDGAYHINGMIEFDSIDAALVCIRDDINDVSIHNVIRLYHNGEIIGEYRGETISVSYNGQYDDWSNYGPLLGTVTSV